MARGEPGKVGPRGAGLAIGAIFGALCLASLTLVATCTRSCTSCVPSAIAPVPAASEPFAGAAAAIEELAWRDATRARPGYAMPAVPDAHAARVALEDTLAARGYVQVQVADDARGRSLPFEAAIGALEGACGIVAVLGVGNASLLAVDGPAGAVAASDPSVVAIAACGATSVRATGTGMATIAAWQLPGITPSDVSATGLGAEIVLAHAEAEALWRARGWEPRDEIVQEFHAARSTGFISPPAGVAPTSGCVAWVGVAIGAGRAETMSRGTLLGRDYARDRALFGAVSCAASSGVPATSTSLTDEHADGYVVHWRAWGTSGAGPSRSSVAVAPTAGSLRVVDVRGATTPPPFPAASAP
ncbi:hypothetical protein [Sandaracinus amylolyticus]|uniref:Uncharacterized protein n=1 Tax=Sandaracinus amylolyticus TaxID=927083 RepID=A0A0F6YIE8_9BACT|nr:hypothetical protein [Sandaracinus amylolyticus]AKF06953.1 hypothetical protein DB32_004102 [Sandaracinus amylolyticus]